MPYLGRDPKMGLQNPQRQNLSVPPMVAPPPKNPLLEHAKTTALTAGADAASAKLLGTAATTGLGKAALGQTAAGTALASAFGPAAIGYVGLQAIKGGK